MIVDKLLDCPFCGGEKIRDGHIRDGRRVYCADCSASVTAFQPNASEHAASLWNCRPSHAALIEERDRLRREAETGDKALLHAASEVNALYDALKSAVAIMNSYRRMGYGDEVYMSSLCDAIREGEYVLDDIGRIDTSVFSALSSNKEG